MPRIVSLIASATEIVCALGFEHDLVGRSHECDYPHSILHLPVCTTPKFAVEGSSAEIDERVKGLLKESNSVYDVDEALLRELRPDVIVTQSQCEVCAVSLRDVARVAENLDPVPTLVTLNPNAMSDVFEDIQRVAAALNVPDRGELLCAEMNRRLLDIAVRLPLTRPTVVCVEWIEPLMAAGNWMPQLVKLAGGISLAGVEGKHSPWLTWEDLRAKDPDVLIFLPCGFDLERTRRELAVLTARPDWTELTAVRKGRVFITDGDQYFNRPGPRLVESTEILAEILHPAVHSFGHEGTGWERIR